MRGNQPTLLQLVDSLFVRLGHTVQNLFIPLPLPVQRFPLLLFILLRHQLHVLLQLTQFSIQLLTTCNCRQLTTVQLHIEQKNDSHTSNMRLTSCEHATHLIEYILIDCSVTLEYFVLAQNVHKVTMLRIRRSDICFFYSWQLSAQINY